MMLSPRNHLKLVLLAGTVFSAPVIAQELPSGASVTAGLVDIATPGPGAMMVTQGTPTAIVNWNSFSIGAGGSVVFAQPNGQSVILNRVTGSATTSIAGQLTANGQVYIVNPNGLAITQSGVVSAGGFVGSTLNISDDDFLAGRGNFVGDGSSAGVSNAGTVNIVPGGYAALIGGRVDNSGDIIAPLGKVGLGAGERVTLDFSGDGFLQVALPSEGTAEDLITQSGTIIANGGAVQISAAAAQDAARRVINLSGVVEARTVSGRSGSITLGGGGGQVVVTGRLDVSAPAPVAPPVPQARSAALGGSVTITGGAITLAGATIDASGADGGGQVRVGGDFHGGGVLPQAAWLDVDGNTVINADATSDGNGGTVVLWSDLVTNYEGYISARGAGQGNGGFVEVSGEQYLAYQGLVDLRAQAGVTGTLLLDPWNVTISTAPTTNIAGAPNYVPTGTSNLNNVDLQNQLAFANVLVTTGGAGSPGTDVGDILVTAPLTWTSGYTLTLNAFNDIVISNNISGAGLVLLSGRDIVIGSAITGGGSMQLNATRDIVFNADVAASGLALQAGRDAVFNTAPTRTINVGAGGFTLDAQRVYLGGSGSAQLVVTSAGTIDVAVLGVDGAPEIDPALLAINLTSAGDTTFTTQSVLIINPFSTVTSTGGNVYLSAPVFQNFGGANAINAAGRYLIYSNDWTTTQRGGLAGGNLYSRTFALNPPGTIPGTGSAFIYANSPVLTLTAADQARLYGAMPITYSNFTYAGLVNGDTIAQALDTTPIISDTTSQTAPAGTYAGALTFAQLLSTMGYTLVYQPGDLTVTPAVLNVPPASPFTPPTMVLDNPADELPGALIAEVTADDARLSLQVLEQRSQDFQDAIEQCQVELKETDDSGSFIDCASDALESYGDAIDDPLIQLPPELQGTVTVIRQTVQRMRTAAANPDRAAGIAEARAAVGDLVDFVRGQTELVRAVEPETEALLVQHGTVIAGAIEQLDLALVGAVEI